MTFRTDTGVDVEMPQAECIVQHDGVILCVPMTTYATFCESDHTWWPYDMMNCTIHIASWSHGSNEISLRSFTLNDVCMKLQCLEDLVNYR